jgi:hypothetical protein
MKGAVDKAPSNKPRNDHTTVKIEQKKQCGPVLALLFPYGRSNLQISARGAATMTSFSWFSLDSSSKCRERTLFCHLFLVHLFHFIIH